VDGRRVIAIAEARPLDTSEQRDVWVLPLRDGTHVRLSAAAYELLRAVDAGASFEEIAARARSSAAAVEAAYHDVLARIARSQGSASRPPHVWVKVRLLPAALVRRVAAYGQLAFHPLAATLLAAFIVFGIVLALANRSGFVAGEFWKGYALFLCALVAHELGHASACARFGAAPSEIGFLLYLIYPAFYSNVSAAWTLTRRQRVVVDLGGIYFELVFGAGCALAFALTHWAPLGVTLALIASSCIVSLNPILKFDGYWVAADALGVTNLARQPAVLFRYVVRGLRGRPRDPLPWPPVVAAILAVYTVLTLVFLVWFVALLVPTLIGVVRAYPSLVVTAIRAPSFAHVSELVTASYLVLFTLLLFRRIIRR
jgi:putative peptide zinc metalloprotease protein